MNNVLKFIKKHKCLISINLAVIIAVIIFPMKELTSKYVTGYNRSGIIMMPNVVITQKFTSELDNIERVSLLLSTDNKNPKCGVHIALYDDNKELIVSKEVSNHDLKNVATDDYTTTDYVNIYPKKILKNTRNNDFYIEVSTDCNNIVKLQYCNAELSDEKAMYNNQETLKKLPMRYSGIKNYSQAWIYPIGIFIISIIIALGGKNEKK